MKKNILIVGGSSSIGKEVIKNLKIKQYNIYATYNLNKIKNNKIKTFNVNLQNLNEIKKLIYNFKKEKIKFDNVIFLQGILFSLNLERYSEKKILDVFSINNMRKNNIMDGMFMTVSTVGFTILICHQIHLKPNI